MEELNSDKVINAVVIVTKEIMCDPALSVPQKIWNTFLLVAGTIFAAYYWAHKEEIELERDIAAQREELRQLEGEESRKKCRLEQEAAKKKLIANLQTTKKELQDKVEFKRKQLKQPPGIKTKAV